MPTVVTTVDALMRALAPHINRGDLGLVAIDGWAGAGKSHLATVLARRLGGTHINLDDFLDEKKDGFVAHLRYGEVATAVGGGRDRGFVVLDGVCVLEVLSRLNRQPGVHIYVKCMLRGIQWLPEATLARASAAEALAHEEQQARFYAKLSDRPLVPGEGLVAGLERDLIDYHYRYRPHETADLVYERASL